MSTLYDIYESDPSRESDGVWVNFGPHIEVKVRRMNSQPVRESHKRFSAPHVHYSRSGRDLPEEIANEIAVKVMADAVIADWRGSGLQTRDGEPIPNTFEAKVDTLSDPRLKNFRDAIAVAASDQDLFKEADDREAEKN